MLQSCWGLTCMGDTATRFESDLDKDFDSCRSNTLRGTDLILPRVHALSSYPAPGKLSLDPPPVRFPTESSTSPFCSEDGWLSVDHTRGESSWSQFWTWTWSWLTFVWNTVRYTTWGFWDLQFSLWGDTSLPTLEKPWEATPPITRLNSEACSRLLWTSAEAYLKCLGL